MKKTYPKAERLKSSKIIDLLFSAGKSFAVYPLRIVWVSTPLNDDAYPVKMALSVPKRKFPKAHQRNQLRRQIREAYRLQKHKLYKKLADQDQQYAMMIIYVGKEAIAYTDIQAAMKKLLHRFALSIEH